MFLKLCTVISALVAFNVTSRYRKRCNEGGARSEKLLALHPTVHLHTGCLNRVVAKALYRVQFTFSSMAF